MHRNPRNMAGRTPDKYRNNQCIRLRPLRLKGEAAISICCSFSYNSFFISCSKLAFHVDGALFGDCKLPCILVLAESVGRLQFHKRCQDFIGATKYRIKYL